MLKFLILVLLQFCSRNMEMGVMYKQPKLEQSSVDLKDFFWHFCLEKDSRFAEEKVGSKFGVNASKYKDSDDRNLLTGFLVYNRFFKGYGDSFFDVLDFFIKLNRESLFERDNLGNSFLHYLIIHTASIASKVEGVEDRVVQVLENINLKDCDLENSFKLTQVLLAELLGLKKIANFIKSNNEERLYENNKKRIKEINELRKKILEQGLSFAMKKSWSESEAYTFVVTEAFKSNSKEIPTSVLGYCMMSITNEVKKTLLEAFHRNYGYEEWSNRRENTRKECINKYVHATDIASMVDAAASSGDNDLVVALSRGVSKNDLFKPLYHAASSGHERIVDHLLMLGVDPNGLDSYNEITPLAVAVQRNHIEVVTRLLKVPGIDLNKSGKKGKSPIELAVERSSVDMVRAILDAGANLNKIPLISKAIAIHENPYEIVEELLKRKVNPNQPRNEFGKKVSPLQEAVKKSKIDNVKLVNLLMKNGANPNLPGCPACPLYLAARQCNIVLIDSLLKGGADPNFYSKVEFLPLLYIEGQLFNYQNNKNKYGDRPEYISKLKKVKVLLEKHGAKTNAPTKDGVFPIHDLAQCKKDLADGMMEALLNSGVDVDLQDSKGKTPLYYAGVSCQVEKFIALIKKGASLAKAKKAGLDVTALSEKGQRALIHHLAEGQYFEEILEMKKDEKKLNLNIQTVTGKTILHYAVIKNVPDNVIDKLIEAGCKLNLKENDSRYGTGRFPIQIALRAKNWRIFRHLYTKMLADPEAAKLLEKDKNLKEDIEERAKDNKIKEFMKKAQEDAKGKGKKRKVGDDSVGPKKKKAKVVQAGPKGKGTKRKADDDDDVDDKEKLVKKAKVVQKGKKAKGKKK